MPKRQYASMGFPLEHVLTKDDLLTEFVCAICQQLSEPAVYTPCSHVFCERCIHEWIARASGGGCRCPHCNANLPASSVLPLKTACPLGARLLSRVKCECPLVTQGCKWRGEYSEVQPHLTNSESHSALSQGTTLPPVVAGASSKGLADGTDGDGGGGGLKPGSSRATAEALKEQGNSMFEQRKYRDAITLYSKAISLAPGITTYYTNRAAAWIRCGAYSEAEADCRRALRIDPTMAKAYLRLSKALVSQPCMTVIWHTVST